MLDEQIEKQPYGIPEGAKLVPAAGEPSDVSLIDEYADAPAERREDFAKGMAAIDAAERRAHIEGRGIRLYGLEVEL